MKPPPIVTLTTDFGTADHFVASMKWVILGIAPSARIVDISHQVQPFQVSEGAFLIAEAYRYFPKRSVHVVVVDPGVGTSRRPILVEADSHYFVGPDNGVLAPIYTRNKARIRGITNAKFFLPNPSRTFHGRDIFAPAAAHLAQGARPSQFGKVIDDYLRPMQEGPTRIGHRAWAGAVARVDRFGNLITNFDASAFPAVETRPFVLLAGVHRTEKLVQNYAEAGPGELAVIVGSSGRLEVVMNQRSASEATKCAAGTPVELWIY